MKDWLAKYPTIRVVLDVHRDALVGTDGAIYKLISQENEKKVAQVMLVVGTDSGGASHPGWADNLALAVRLQKELISDYVSLARPIALRSSSYNRSSPPAPSWWRWGATATPSPRPWTGRGSSPRASARCSAE